MYIPSTQTSTTHKGTAAQNFKVFTAAVTSMGGEGKFLAIIHQDLDGACTAALLVKALGVKYKQVDIVFTQPYWSRSLVKFLAKGNRLEKYAGVALLDVSVDYASPKDSEALFDFLQHSGKLVYLIDHHTGWDKILARHSICKDYSITIDDETHQIGTTHKRIILGAEACCAKLVYDAFPTIQDADSTNLMRIAAISDDLIIRQEMKDTPEYALFSQLKSLRLWDAMTQILAKPDLVNITDRGVDWVAVNNGYADTLLSSIKEVYPGIGYLSSLGDQQVNYTAIFERAYTKYKILIIKDLDPKHFRLSFKIGHCISDLDLTKIFHLKGGNSKRITLYSKRMVVADLVARLSPYVDALKTPQGISILR